jgi:pimeloyl-ACP methyl ester carboxylesterase
VTLLQGQHDFCTPSEPVVKWFNQLQSPMGKELIWFEHSAHWPQIEENEKFANLIIQRVQDVL